MDAVAAYPIKLNTKLFCSCRMEESCPVCRCIPGMLPLINREALRKAVVCARMFGLNPRLSRFYRIPALHDKTVLPVLSMRPEPIGAAEECKAGEISAVYLEESFTVKREPVYGLPLIVLRRAGDDPDFSLQTARLYEAGIIAGEPEIYFREEKRNLTLYPPLPADISGMKDGIYRDIFYDTSLIPAEPELDTCVVHIDPVSADMLLAGYDDDERLARQ